jgi:inner membrane protein
MPTAFTHAFCGAALSALAPRKFRGLTLGATLAVVAAIPDLDVLAFRFGIPYAHPLGHRGFSHSLTFALLMGFLLLPLLRRGLPRAGWRSAPLFLVIVSACASHGILDAFTDAGLGVGFFIPFDDTRYFFPWRPILTSPLSIGSFLSGRGVAIMMNELIWVWLPVSALLTVVLGIRRMSGHGLSESSTLRS